MRVLATDEGGLVLAADHNVGDDWEAVRSELSEAFRLTKQAVTEGRSVVYVVHNDDLLGRDGLGAAIVATGLLSAARTAALEHRELSVNTLAVARDSSPDDIGIWSRHLLAKGGPSGELVRLGRDHLGKALP
jgi:hypothetical protein